MYCLDRTRHPEPAVGNRTAFCRRHRRPFRRHTRDDFRRGVLCGGSCADGAATTPGMLNVSAGVLIGLGLSGCSFNLVIGAFGKLLPDSWRSLAFGAGTAASSIRPISLFADRRGADGQIWLADSDHDLCRRYDVNSAAGDGVGNAQDAGQQRNSGSKADAIGAAGFCGSIRPSQLCPARARLFHLRLSACICDRAFAVLFDRSRLPPRSAAGCLATIGLFNIIGSLTSGAVGNRIPKRYILSIIYFRGRSQSSRSFRCRPVRPRRWFSAQSPGCCGSRRCRQRLHWSP